MHLLRHSFTREFKKKRIKTNKNENTQQRKRKCIKKTQKKKTHIFKSEEAKKKPRCKFLENYVNLAVASTKALNKTLTHSPLT